MMDLIYAGLIVVGAYVIGSIPSGLVLAQARGIDIRDFGSGNIGATNVSRALGKRLGGVVLVLDALKGAVPLIALLTLGLHRSVDPFLLTLTGFAAIMGHCFSIFLGFHGGKGVATSLGVFIVLEPLAALGAVVVFAGLYAAFRVASVGSVVAAASMAVWLLVLNSSDAVVTLAVASALLIVFTHRSNLGRLVRGNEHKA